MTNLVRVHTAYGPLEASVVKARLEAGGIPSLLRYEAAGPVFGIVVDGLGRVDVLVPEGLAEQARDLLAEQPGEVPEAEVDGGESS